MIMCVCAVSDYQVTQYVAALFIQAFRSNKIKTTSYKSVNDQDYVMNGFVQ